MFAYLSYVPLILFFLFIPQKVDATSPEESIFRKGRDSDHALVYISDYFSFIGRDAQGHVAFALDNNRGKDGESYQAEHFAVLHDEEKGWMAIQGNGPYDNVAKDLTSIPDSSTFQFQGDPEVGMTINSESNELTLKTSPILKAFYRTHNGGEIWMGSSSATLQWADRTLKGRVIYEYLLIPDFNRLSRTYWGFWKEFQGFYLSLDGVGDLYIHSQQSEKLALLIGELDGFLTIDEKPKRFQVLQLTPLRFSQGLGFYRWPMGWAIRWMTSNGGGSVQFELSQFQRMANWVIGGFAMGIVQGSVKYQGKSIPVYGMVELIM